MVARAARKAEQMEQADEKHGAVASLGSQTHSEAGEDLVQQVLAAAHAENNAASAAVLRSLQRQAADMLSRVIDRSTDKC